MLSSRRTLPAVLVCLFMAAAVPFAGRALTGPAGALVHVRWASSVDKSTRRALEQRFHLSGGERQDEDTWRYDLRDPSAANLRRLITDRAVADTHHIDRAGFSIDATATRTTRPER